MRFLYVLPLVAAAALQAGCADPEAPPPTTADFSPAEISLYTQLQTNGWIAQISVTAMGGGQSLGLGAGDALVLRVPGGGPVQALAFADAGFFGQLETDAASFELVFSRGASEIVTSLDVPPAFSLTGPTLPASRAAPIPLAWGPPGQNFETWLDLIGPCLSWPISRYFTAEVESYEIQPADLAIEPGSAACALHVWVTRSATAGALAPGLGPASEPGAISVRSISIDTFP